MLQLLVVEPDHDISELLQEDLQEVFEAKVALASNGEQAKRVFHKRTLDLAVMEATLPDMSGFELAEIAVNCNIPSLLMSGHPAGQETCKDYGYPHLDKPFSLRDLTEAARAILRDSRRTMVRLHQSYQKLSATFSRTHLVAEAARRTRDEATQLRGTSRQIREESSRVHIESAEARTAKRSPPASTAFGRSMVLLKIVVLHRLLLEAGTGLGPGMEHAVKLLLAEEAAKLAALDAARRDGRPLC